MIMNNKNQAKCPYCHKFCKKVQGLCVGYGKYAKWQECPECKTKFAVGPKATLKGAKYKVLDPRNDDAYYTMEINYKNNTTWIYHYRRPDYQLTTASQLTPGNYSVSSVTPGKTYNFAFTGGRLIWSHSEQSVVKLEKAVKDITPENVSDKIKMYILFS